MSSDHLQERIALTTGVRGVICCIPTQQACALKCEQGIRSVPRAGHGSSSGFGGSSPEWKWTGSQDNPNNQHRGTLFLPLIKTNRSFHSPRREVDRSKTIKKASSVTVQSSPNGACRPKKTIMMMMMMMIDCARHH